MHNAFWLPCGTGSIKDIQGMFAIEGNRFMGSACLIHQVMPPEITALPHSDLGTGASEDDHFFNARTSAHPIVRFGSQSSIDIFFQFDNGSSAECSVGG